MTPDNMSHAFIAFNLFRSPVWGMSIWQYNDINNVKVEQKNLANNLFRMIKITVVDDYEKTVAVFH